MFAPGPGDVPFEPGTDGLYPPGAAARAVHGDMATMMIGGVAALLMQMLHPRTLAGVWDHSNFREDLHGRLRRTARFIAATTYGRMQDAEAAIARVRRIHDRVRGTMPDGSAYSANDPDLLTWVHVAGSWSFLAAYQRYGAPLPRAEQDRYYRETAEVSYRLGADEVPLSAGEVEAYFRRIRPELKSDARTREVIGVLLSSRAASPALAPAHAITLRAGVDLMPAWARRMHGLTQLPGESAATRLAAAAMVRAAGWILKR
jgi:uncharacterized protein (DUF2236 family)